MPRRRRATPSGARGRPSTTDGWRSPRGRCSKPRARPWACPPALMGNSEVGHLTLGAGRMLPQDLLRIDLALRDGSFSENPALTAAIQHARRRGATLHVMGLLSDGGVHSHQRHLEGLLELAPQGRRAARPGARLRGRARHAAALGPRLRRASSRPRSRGSAERSRRCRAATTRWTATSGGTAWRAPTRRSCFPRACTRRARRKPIEAAYERDENDEFIQPTVITEDGEPLGPIADGDAVVFFNFRADRARQLTRALTEAGVRRLPAAEAPEDPLRRLHGVQGRVQACRPRFRRAP